MTTIDTHAGAASPATGSPSFVGTVGDWVTSGDHKRIGRMWLGSTFLLAVVTLLFGALIGLERVSSDSSQIFPDDAVLQVVQMNRFGLVLGVLAPLFVAVAIAVVPMQVGSRAIALPRLAQYGFWTWLLGVVLYVVALAGNGGAGGGTTDLVDLSLLASVVTATGVLAGAVSVAVTVTTSRAPGMSLDRVPLFSWAALVGAVAAILSLPVVIGTLVYLYVDHTHAGVAFGGNDALSSWFDWSLTQPMTMVFVVGALGVLAEVAPVAGRVRHPARGPAMAGLGLVSIAALAAVTQTSHTLSWDGSAGDTIASALLYLVFNGLPVLGVLAVVGTSALAVGRSSGALRAPFVLAASGALMILAGVGANALGAIDDVGVTGTVFEEGVLLYLVTGALLSALAALAHWSPKLSGRVAADKKLLPAAALGLVGSILTSLPLIVFGIVDKPARQAVVFEVGGSSALWSGLSVAGLVLVVVAVLAGLAAVRAGDAASDDPWDGHTLEWAIPSPAPADNFAELAMVGSAEPLLDVKPREVAP